MYLGKESNWMNCKVNKYEKFRFLHKQKNEAKLLVYIGRAISLSKTLKLLTKQYQGWINTAVSNIKFHKNWEGQACRRHFSSVFSRQMGKAILHILQQISL